jgi:hypothetical protein
VTAPKPFWDWAFPEPNTGCWLWTGGCFSHGYGKLRYAGKTSYAHRVAYELHHGVTPEDGYVCHRCDNPPCINPDHLFLGTARDNALDMFRKGRARHNPVKGDAHWAKTHGHVLSAALKARYAKHPPARRGVAHHAHRLSEHDVPIIRTLSLWGVSNAQLGRMYSLNPATIRAVVVRRNWRHVP